MNARSQTSDQMTLFDTPNATSSPASGSGRTHSDKPDGPTSDPSGPDPVPVSRSASPEAAKVLRMLDTFGRSGRVSLASAALASSLVNKLQVRLDSCGSTLFTLTWKTRATPSQRLIAAHRASERRTDGSVSTSLPTPRSGDGTSGAEHLFRGPSNPTLLGAARLAAWPTPRAEDSESTGAHRGTADTLHSQTQLAA